MSTNCQGFVISLERTPRRRENARRLVAALPCPGEVLDAVDGALLDTEAVGRVYRPGLLSPRYPFPLSGAEIGCFLSHCRAWREIVGRELDFGVVLEDDVVLAPEFPAVVEALSRLPGWSVVQLHPGRWHHDRLVLAAEGLRLLHATPPRLRAGGLCLRRNAAAKLLAASETFDRSVDAFLQMEWVHGVPIAHLGRPVVLPDDQPLGGSTIQVSRRRLGPAWAHRQLARWLYRRRIAKLSAAHFRAPPGPGAASD